MFDQEAYLNEASDEFLKIINKNFPDQFIRSWGYSGPQITARLAHENAHFQNTDYYYQDELKFFHVTSLPLLFSILNERKIRLYNLHNSSDIKEYYHAAELLRVPSEEVENRKQYLYTFSFCPYSNLNNQFIWENYGGGNQTGVALVFSIRNNPANWNRFHLSKIKYSPNEKFERLFQDQEQLHREYTDVKTNIDLSKLVAFHKSEEFAVEKEVRLITYRPYDTYMEYVTHSKTEYRVQGERSRFVNYLELPLWVDNDAGWIRNQNYDLDRSHKLPDDYFTIHPEIHIDDILFGVNCGIGGRELINVQQRVEQLIRHNFGYNINLTLNLFNLSD